MHGLALTLAAACCLLPLMAHAAWLVPVYTVDVAERGGTALQDAMRQVLVRATGHREAADDPQLAALIANAPKYVKGYDTGARGQSQVLFDGPAIDQAITAAGRTVWDSSRAFTLVVLDPPRARAAADAARVQLEKTAAERGLPVSVIPLTLVDASGKPLEREALLDAVHSYGADQLLVGRGPAAGAEGTLQWTRYTRGVSQSWTGSLASGIDHTADGLVPQPAGALAQDESTVRVRIEGLNTLTDYATVVRLLQGTPGVRRAGIAAADAASASFDVSVRGGAAGLEQSLAGQSHLVHTAGVGYRYQPQGVP